MKAIIRQEDLDAARRTTKWKDADKLSAFIWDGLLARMSRGSAFMNRSAQSKESSKPYTYNSDLRSQVVSDKSPTDNFIKEETDLGDFGPQPNMSTNPTGPLKKSIATDMEFDKKISRDSFPPANEPSEINSVTPEKKSDT